MYNGYNEYLTILEYSFQFMVTGLVGVQGRVPQSGRTFPDVC